MMSIKHYTDPELLEINTLENAIYMAMQNDVSFMIGLRLGYDRQKQIIRFTKNFDSAGIRHLL